jgi:peptidoglycan hydrolase-like protein with peptidoglycan-binding domain
LTFVVRAALIRSHAAREAGFAFGGREAARMRNALRVAAMNASNAGRAGLLDGPAVVPASRVHHAPHRSYRFAIEESAMRMSGRWVRRGSTVVLFGIDRDDGAGDEWTGDEWTGDARTGFERAVARELPLEVAATGRPTLRRGASARAVVDLQTRLTAAGFSAGTADGYFGPLTDAAVRAFQRSRGLVADGIVGSQTWAALESAGSGRWGTGRAPTSSGGTSAASGPDPAIEVLSLTEPARSAAYAIKRKHPWVVFTSGRRDAARQASAMAGNVVHNRRWIAQTYASNPVSAAAQAWVDAHPEARTQQAIAGGLLSVFRTFSPRDLGRLSQHLSGLAFDVRPVPAQAAAFWSTVLSLPGLRQHFDTEGGRTIWHVGF